jgi:hypothetical protein
MDIKHFVTLQIHNQCYKTYKKVRLSTGDKLTELFITHPNMLKSIKHLSTLAF